MTNQWLVDHRYILLLRESLYTDDLIHFLFLALIERRHDPLIPANGPWKRRYLRLEAVKVLPVLGVLLWLAGTGPGPLNRKATLVVHHSPVTPILKDTS